MSLTETNCPAVTATPLSVKVPPPGNVVISTAKRLFAGLSFRSLNPKSAALKTYAVSSSVVTVLLAPCGASLTLLTVRLELAVAELKAVVPPFVVVLAVPPLAPLLWSQARNVIPVATVPFQLAAGKNRTRVLASAASSRADAVEGVPNASHVEPPLIVYCHDPCVLSAAVTAIPDRAPKSESVTSPATSADTSVPEFVTSSSLIVVTLFEPDRTGA